MPLNERASEVSSTAPLTGIRSSSEPAANRWATAAARRTGRTTWAATRLAIRVSARASAAPPSSRVFWTTVMVLCSPASRKIRYTPNEPLSVVAGAPTTSAGICWPSRSTVVYWLARLPAIDVFLQLDRDVPDTVGRHREFRIARRDDHRVEHAGRRALRASGVGGAAQLGRAPCSAPWSARPGRSPPPAGCCWAVTLAASISPIAASVLDCSRPVMICCWTMTPTPTITSVDNSRVSTMTRSRSERPQSPTACSSPSPSAPSRWADRARRDDGRSDGRRWPRRIGGPGRVRRRPAGPAPGARRPGGRAE